MNNSDPFVVERPIFEYVSVVDYNNEFKKNIKTTEALNIAKVNGLDLVCFKRGQNTELPFCKMINFGKWKYAEEKRKKKQKQHSIKRVVKELQFSPDIGDNDIKHKIKQAIEFIQRGDEVVLRMILMGRQRLHAKDAEVKLNEIAGLCKDVGEEVKRERSENNIIIRMKKVKKEIK